MKKVNHVRSVYRFEAAGDPDADTNIVDVGISVSSAVQHAFTFFLHEGGGIIFLSTCCVVLCCVVVVHSLR